MTSLEFFKTKVFNENGVEILLKERVDHCWRNIELMKNIVGDLKYPVIIKVVKAALILAHGNAEVKGIFQKVPKMLQKIEMV